ncbi:MAG: DUF5018 domain-containing protein [Anaerovoracaceae bacterium]
MKKYVNRLISALLALVLILAVPVDVFAEWPGNEIANKDNYLCTGTLMAGDTAFSKSTYTVGGFITVYLLPQGAAVSEYKVTPTAIDFSSNPLAVQKENTASLEMGVEYDLSNPVCYNVIASDGRYAPVFIMAAEGTGGWSGWTEQDSENLLAMSDLIADTLYEIRILQDEISNSTDTVGEYYSSNADMLSALGYWLGRETAYYDDESTGQNGNGLYDSYADTIRKGKEETRAFVRQYLENHLENQNVIPSSSVIKPETLKIIYEKIIPYYIEYAKQRIETPEITAFVLGGSVGRIDNETRTITVPIPEGTDVSSLGEAEIVTKGWSSAVRVANSDSSMVYYVTPCYPAKGTRYDSYSQKWTVNIIAGTPDNIVTSFSVESNGAVRYAKIDQEAKTITLNLPTGTDITAITPVIEHTGTNTNFDGRSIDFTNEQELVLTNSNFSGVETRYTVRITAAESDENYITSYKIGDAAGTISENRIEITIPYALDLTATQPEIEISEFASITGPETPVVGENIYEVTSESGEKRTYTVNVTRTAAATGRSILSFSYGSASAVINETAGTISLELPKGTPLQFAPTIKVSPFASVSPASGETRDFSQPVKYTVTAQDGRTNTYTVEVSVSSESAENPYIDGMRSLVNKIISNYKSGEADDDWEWMNLGFYQNKLENYDYGFSIADCISKLEADTNVAMTNIDRKIMTLTARGFDCSNLAKYNGGEPFIDKNGNKIDNLVEVLYNYSGGWTINGPTFALIALDMGNYTIPADAKWTREVLLETLLNHVYLSDGFGLDMVTMMMQAMAPYQNDPVYGERVKAKLEEGFEIVLSSFGSKNAYNNPFGVQWGGIYTSEGSAQVLCAISAMGIDAYSDVRLNDGTHSALSALLDYANYEDGYFHHSSTVLDNAMATYQGCYASQWYLGFIDNGGAGNPYSLYYQRFDFSRKLSEDASITAFILDGKEGVITEGGEGGQNAISVVLPKGTSLKSMYPKVALAKGATLVAPNLDQPVTFIEGVAQPFTVQAEDGKTRKTYYVTITLSEDVLASGAEIFPSTIKLEDANILRDLEILEMTVTEAGDGATEIELAVNAGVNTAALHLTAQISSGAVCTPAVDGKTKLDLTDWTTFTVVSQDGTNTGIYRIKVTPREQAYIEAFSISIDGTVYNGVIDNDKNTITVSGVDDSSLTTTKFVPDITLGGNTLVCSPAPGLAQDFSKTVSYTVSGGGDVVSRVYTVSVLNSDGELISSVGGSSGSEPVTPTVTGAKIISFKVLGIEGVIDNAAGTITITLPYGCDITAVAPEVEVPSGAIVSPCSGEVVNLANDMVYAVQNGEEIGEYRIIVILEKSISDQLWEELVDNNTVKDHQVSYDKSKLS